MEGLLVLLGLLFFAWPFVPLFMAISARSKANRLENEFYQLRDELAATRLEVKTLQQRVQVLQAGSATIAAAAVAATERTSERPDQRTEEHPGTRIDPKTAATPTANLPSAAQPPAAASATSRIAEIQARIEQAGSTAAANLPPTAAARDLPATAPLPPPPQIHSEAAAASPTPANAGDTQVPATAPNFEAAPAPTSGPISAAMPVPTPAPAQTHAPTPAHASVPASAPAHAAHATPADPARPPAAATPHPPVRRAAPVRAPEPPPAWLLAVKEWLFGGNLVAKMGLLILFIGVSFLLKYAASRVTIPIEFRLSAIVLADIALLVWGWRIRLSRPGIALPVQGAALSILMMVTFAAFRIYELIPGGMAFGLLFTLTAFTCLLAVLQDALWLAIFGIIGGFAAPILTSTGNGSHIGLFSYYALLNLGIFAIARYRAWRALNLLGFLFTFVIGTAWGMLKYEPAHYLSAQLFLLLFFLFYVAIALVYGAKQAPQLKNYVDATLVFGTPMIGFGLQYGLVKHLQFGTALSSLALGLFYTALALALWKKRGGTLKLLTESFLALGIIFGTLAIPFALDGRWTSACWALEGAGILWVGLRQKQKLVWLFGLLVQLGAWLSFLGSVANLDSKTAAQSNLWLGFLILAGTAFMVATRFRAQTANSSSGSSADGLPSGEQKSVADAIFDSFATLFLAGASIWLVAGAWTEIFLHTSGSTQATLIVVSALLTVTMLGWLAKSMAWPVARGFAMLLQIVTGALLLALSLSNLGWPEPVHSANLFDGPFLGALLIGAAALFSARVFQQQQADPSTPAQGARMLLCWSAFWWFAQILHALTGWAALLYGTAQAAPQHGIDPALYWYAYALGLAISSPLWLKLATRLQWPDLRWLAMPLWLALAWHSGDMLWQLIVDNGMPGKESWITFAALWLAAEWQMQRWQKAGWAMTAFWLRTLHLVRSVTPWLMIWPVGAYWMRVWLAAGSSKAQALLEQADWSTSASWARYIPAWLMMAATAWLMHRIRQARWPVEPLAMWYRRRLLPLACGWPVFLAAIWNITQDGSMAPLPYLPLLNPLDLTTGFALLLTLATYQEVAAHNELATYRELAARHAKGKVPLPFIALLPVYTWFNLILLRTASHWLGIKYEFDALFDSSTVQVMLSLVWSITALILMRYANRKRQPQPWLWGAGLLAVVVAKLFLVDQANKGGVERIIAFVGVGVLMLVIGYLAPFPGKDAPPKTAPEPEPAPEPDPDSNPDSAPEPAHQSAPQAPADQP